jgi:2-keto-3-deoxy-L-rhamnonate aldolase RhmA
MQAANRAQKALRAGAPSFGAWQMLPGANHSRFMARSGYDWICVDTEHGNIAGMVLSTMAMLLGEKRRLILFSQTGKCTNPSQLLQPVA